MRSVRRLIGWRGDCPRAGLPCASRGAPQDGPGPRGFWHITIHYGFIEVPDLPSVLREARARGCPINPDHAIYFGARYDVVRGKGGGRLSRWRLPLFAFLFRNSVRAADLF